MSGSTGQQKQQAQQPLPESVMAVVAEASAVVQRLALLVAAQQR